MNLSKNTLLQFTDTGTTERILWVNTKCTHAVMIEIFGRTALPFLKDCNEIQAEISSGQIRILTQDFYTVLQQPDFDSNPKYKRYRKSRDRAWSMIEPIVDDPRIFDPKTRPLLILEASSKKGIHKRHFYKYLRRYWQGGQTPNALLPHYFRCGNSEKPRKQPKTKRGRPRKPTVSGEVSVGINLDLEIEGKILKGMKEFYECIEHITFKEARQRTLEKFFNSGYEPGRGGVPVPLLPPAEELPSTGQFRYVYKKKQYLPASIKARVGDRDYPLKHREILGESTSMAFGPGSIFQIDATSCDIYLRSSVDPKRIIGRPVVYVVQDVFSRYIAGIAAALEGPSWIIGATGVENCGVDKVEFCAEYDIPIQEEEWMIHHIPEAILADRGEFEGYNADNLVKSLRIKIANTPPRRADWKGIIEKNFHLLNEKFRFVPGFVNKYKKRSGKDYRFDAVLDLRAFMQLLILCVLDHNNRHRLRYYKLSKQMVADGVQPYPAEILKWGLLNRGGKLRSVSRDILRLNLLPTGEARVTKEGISFQGLFYHCDLARREQWYVRARHSGTWKVQIAYDPRKVDTIYIRLNGGKSLEVCKLIREKTRFSKDTWYDALDHFELEKRGHALTVTDEQRDQAEVNALKDEVVKKAKEEVDAAFSGQSKHARAKEIRNSRREERDRNRRKDAWDLTGEGAGQHQNDEVVEHQDQYVGPPDSLGKLRLIRNKMLKKEKP